ncbi:sulfate adenylyltransferase subunit [Wolffia australiana]
MAQLLNFNSCALPASTPTKSTREEWAKLQRKVSGFGRHSCFFFDGGKQERARKALESALDGKKTDFEKWNKEIEKRESSAAAGGGDSGRGGWFGGGGGWFGWSSDERFWDDAKQAGITVGAIVLLILLLAKGSVMFAVVCNSLLFVLRGVRTQAELAMNFISYRVLRTSSPSSMSSSMETTSPVASSLPSAKGNVVSKWASD